MQNIVIYYRTENEKRQILSENPNLCHCFNPIWVQNEKRLEIVAMPTP